MTKPKSKNNRWIEWKIFQGCLSEEIEFHNPIQDWIFTTVYWVVEKCFEKSLKGDHMKINIDYFQMQKWMSETELKK